MNKNDLFYRKLRHFFVCKTQISVIIFKTTA